MKDCLFCKIVKREIPARLVYEDDRMIAIDDIHPQAPMHVLVIPKSHIATLNDLNREHDALVGESQTQEPSPRTKPKNQTYVKLSAMPMTGRWTAAVDSRIAALQLGRRFPRSLKV